MDLTSGYPYWTVRNGLVSAFPRLLRDARCEVLVIGAGITGALIADELAGHGHDVALIDRRDAGWGSTSASTALVQYEIDEQMVDLAKRYGEQPAALAYTACAEAVEQVLALANGVKRGTGARTPSLYLASKARHREDLQAETRLRAKHGFRVRFLDAAAIERRFGLVSEGGILSELGALVDPYLLAHELLARIEKRGGRVWDRSEVTAIESAPRGMIVRTPEATIRCKHVVVACGYESARWLPERVAKNRSTYAFVTDPLPVRTLGKLATTMVWESARPYLYMRPTSDHRLVIGGEDDSMDIVTRRDARVGKRTRALQKRMRELAPDLELLPAYAWAGTFAETFDALPFIGAHPRCSPRVQFALAYGGNGITYSQIGAKMIRAAIEGEEHPLTRLFAFSRLQTR